VTEARQRLDKWLWYARVVKSRTLAQKLVASGNVRVNGARVTAVDHKVGLGDGLTILVHEKLRVLKVLEPGDRRGPASEAATLYEDLSPEIEKPEPRNALGLPVREGGSGRPTKKERRDIDRLRDRES
jgi:ribosome-associated heat shock protein Hsp15